MDERISKTSVILGHQLIWSSLGNSADMGQAQVFLAGAHSGSCLFGLGAGWLIADSESQIK